MFFQANAQRNVIKANIFSPILRTGSFFYEQAVNENSSLQLGFFYTGIKIDETRFSGFGITPEYRLYLSESKDVLNGFYVGPFLRYQNFKLEDELSNDEAKLTTFGGGVLVGHQWIFKERFSLDTFIGPSYFGGSIEVEGDADEEDFSADIFNGFGVRIGVTFGIAF